MKIVYKIKNGYPSIYIKGSSYGSKIYYVVDKINSYDVVWCINKALDFRIVKLRKI